MLHNLRAKIRDLRAQMERLGIYTVRALTTGSRGGGEGGDSEGGQMERLGINMVRVLAARARGGRGRTLADACWPADGCWTADAGTKAWSPHSH